MIACTAGCVEVAINDNPRIDHGVTLIEDPDLVAFFADRRVPRDQENTLDGARSNIAAHYDLSNDLFAAFLDPTMTYSSAWFDESEPVQTATRLEEAQLRKIDGLLDLAVVLHSHLDEPGEAGGFHPLTG